MNHYSNESIFTFPGIIAKVRFPDLSEAERNKRMKILQAASADLMKDHAVKHHRKEKTWQ